MTHVATARGRPSSLGVQPTCLPPLPAEEAAWLLRAAEGVVRHAEREQHGEQRDSSVAAGRSGRAGRPEAGEPPPAARGAHCSTRKDY